MEINLRSIVTTRVRTHEAAKAITLRYEPEHHIQYNTNVVWHDIRLHNCPQTRYTPPRLSLNNSAGVVGRDRVQINLTHNISDSFPPASPISRTTSSNDLKFWEQVEKTTEIRMVPKSWRKSAFEFFENGLIYPTCPGAPRSLRSREPLVSRVTISVEITLDS